MNALLLWLLETSLSTGCLAVVVLAACRLFRHHPATQHLLWLVVLIRFVLPPIVSWPSTVQSTAQRWVGQQYASLAGVSSWCGNLAFWAQSNDRPALVSSPTLLAIDVDELSGNVAAIGESPHATFWSQPVTVVRLAIVLIWLVGLLVSVVIHARRIRACRLLIGQCSPAPDHLLNEIHRLTRTLGMRPVAAQITDRIHSPFLWCYGWLKLVWPMSLSSAADVERSRSVLAHELMHVSRRDHWVTWIELLSSVIWWWNPVYWFVRRRLRESAEMACDAMALSALPDERLAYAELFLKISSTSKPGAPAPVLGVSTGTPSSFERRLTMILSERVSGKLSPWGIGAALTLFSIAGPSLLLGEQKEFENTERKTGNVIYLVDDDGDGVADRPAAAVESDFIDNDPALGKIYYVVDKDPSGQGRNRRKVTIVNTRKIENGIVIHTLGRLNVDGARRETPLEQPPSMPFVLDDPIVGVKIEGNTTILNAEIAQHIKTRLGPVTLEQIKDDVAALVRTTWFAMVKPSIRRTDDGNVLVFHVFERPNGRRAQDAFDAVDRDQKRYQTNKVLQDWLSALQPESAAKESDDQFLRRLSLDTTGQLPTVDEIKQFRDGTDPEKRQKAIKQYADHAALATMLAEARRMADMQKQIERLSAELQEKTVAIEDLKVRRNADRQDAKPNEVSPRKDTADPRSNQRRVAAELRELDRAEVAARQQAIEAKRERELRHLGEDAQQLLRVRDQIEHQRDELAAQQRALDAIRQQRGSDAGQLLSREREELETRARELHDRYKLRTMKDELDAVHEQERSRLRDLGERYRKRAHDEKSTGSSADTTSEVGSSSSTSNSSSGSSSKSTSSGSGSTSKPVASDAVPETTRTPTTRTETPSKVSKYEEEYRRTLGDWVTTRDLKSVEKSAQEPRRTVKQASPGAEQLILEITSNGAGRKLTATDKNTGQRLWAVELDGEASSAIIEGSSVKVSGSGRISFFDRRTGKAISEAEVVRRQKIEDLEQSLRQLQKESAETAREAEPAPQPREQ